METKKIAVVLAGCGSNDGSEIHEATLSLYAIAKNGAQYDIYAPNISQYHVINHITGEVLDEQRNVMVEAARIARGQIKDLEQLDMNQYDAIVFPGGFGAAKNLSNYAFEGASGMRVIEPVKKAVLSAHQLGKPIGALCIAPVIISKVITDSLLTVGQDSHTISEIESLGSKHQTTNNGEVAIDLQNKIVSTPCYMLDASIVDIANGADLLVKELIKLM